MNDDILLWHNAILGEYFSGTNGEFLSQAKNYQRDNLNVLYTMDSSSKRVIEKIKISLNSARGQQADLVLKSA